MQLVSGQAGIRALAALLTRSRAFTPLRKSRQISFPDTELGDSDTDNHPGQLAEEGPTPEEKDRAWRASQSMPYRDSAGCLGCREPASSTHHVKEARRAPRGSQSGSWMGLGPAMCQCGDLEREDSLTSLNLSCSAPNGAQGPCENAHLSSLLGSGGGAAATGTNSCSQGPPVRLVEGERVNTVPGQPWQAGQWQYKAGPETVYDVILHPRTETNEVGKPRAAAFQMGAGPKERSSGCA